MIFFWYLCFTIFRVNPCWSANQRSNRLWRHWSALFTHYQSVSAHYTQLLRVTASASAALRRMREFGRCFAIWIQRAPRTRSRDSSRFPFGHALSGARAAGDRCVLCLWVSTWCPLLWGTSSAFLRWCASVNLYVATVRFRSCSAVR